MNRTEWLAARKGKITSSIVTACLGLSKRMTPFQAKMAILGKSIFDGNKATERGLRLESLVLDYVTERLGLVRGPAELRRHRTHEWAADSCDAAYYRPDDIIGLDDPVAIGEGKTCTLGAAAEYKEEMTDQVPVATWIQSHWHLDHWLEAPVCYNPILVGGYSFEFRMYKIDRDTEIEGQLMDHMAKWHHDYIVKDGTPPVLSEDEEEIKHLYPKHIREIEPIAPDSDIDKLAREYFKVRQQREFHKEQEDVLRASLEVAIADRAGIRGNDWSITYKNNKDSSVINWNEMANEIIDLYCTSAQKDILIAKHTRVKTGARMFLPKMKVEK